MTACRVGKCPRGVFAQGLCERHYDSVRRAMLRDGDWRACDRDRSTQIACRCRVPRWDTCAPMFPSVRVCRWCGSPDAEQFGKAIA